MISKSNKAFSLLEVLITVAILSTAIIFIFRAFTASLSSCKFSQNITFACFLAEDKLWEIEKRYKDKKSETLHPASEIMQNTEFNWDYEKQDIDSELKQLKFAISWQEKVRENEYSIEILTYLPFQ